MKHRRARWTAHVTFLFPFWSRCGGLCEVQFCARSQRPTTDPCDRFHGSSENNSQSITHHGSGACVTESMSVLTDPATYGILNSELTNCPRTSRTAAVVGELAAQWQQMRGTTRRVEQEAVSSPSLANAIENIGRTRTDATSGRLRLKDGERLYPKSCVL